MGITVVSGSILLENSSSSPCREIQLASKLEHCNSPFLIVKAPVTEIKELDSKEIAINDSLPIVIADMEYMKKSAEKIRAMADGEDLYDIVAMMEDNLSEYNKTLWFLKSMVK